MTQFVPPQPGGTRAPSNPLIEKAAVLGGFDPRSIIQQPVHAEWDRQALRQLAEHCQEVQTADGLLWCLKPDYRREALARLGAEHRLLAVSLDTLPLPTDFFGRSLQWAFGNPTEQELPNDLSNLDEFRQALQFAARQSDIAGEMLAEVELRLARRERENALRMLVPEQLIGRKDELDELELFLQGVSEAALPVMCVTGIGGAGKSALLAEFALRTQRSDWSGIPVIILDFDRALLTSASASTLMIELARQLAVSLPGLRERLADFRSKLDTLEVSAQGSGSKYVFEKSASLDSYMWSAWRSILGKALPRMTPILLILDTFEEVLIRGDTETEFVLHWLRGLVSEGELGQLKVVLSGRAAPRTDLLKQVGSALLELTVGGLASGAARELLAQDLARFGVENVSMLPLRQLVERFGGHPLLLKVLARYLREQDPGKAAYDLLQPPKNGETGFDSQFSQAFLYRRILKRIRSEDPAIEALAHPGLALRRVTPDLIKRVLSRPCHLGKTDDARARGLFDHLRGQIWLVEGTAQDEVLLHRRDLRKLMLQTMDEDFKSQTARIHRRAALYYNAGLDRYLSKREQRFEALYHAQMGGVRLEMTEQEIGPLLTYLGADMDQLPLSHRARLKFDAERPLTDIEIESLDPQRRASHKYRNSAQRLSRGTRGLHSYQDFETVTDAFAAGQLDGVLSIFSQDGDMGPGAGDPDLPVTLTTEPIWQIALAVVAQDEAPKYGQQLLELVHNWDDTSWSRGGGGRGMSGGPEVPLASMVAVLLGANPEENKGWQTLSRLAPPRSDISSLDDLRTAALLLPFETTPPSFYRVSVDLLRDREDRFIAVTLDKNHRLSEQLQIQFGDKTLTSAEVAKCRSQQSGDSHSLFEMDIARRRGWFVHADSWPLSQQDRWLLCGCLTELYPAIRGALQRVRQGVILEFAEAQASQAGWPRELSPSSLRGALDRDQARWLSTLIEFCDRRGRLNDLIAHCIEADAPNPVRQVERLLHNYSHRLIDPLYYQRNDLTYLPTGEAP